MTKAGSRLINSAKQAAAIARGEAKPARLYVPAEIDVKAIRARLGVSQDDFASEFGFTVDQIKAWEQNRARPLGGVRAYLILIDAAPSLVRNALTEIRHAAIAAQASDASEPMRATG